MSSRNNSRVCPMELSGGLDNSLRKLLQNPQKILKPYIREEMIVLRFGLRTRFLFNRNCKNAWQQRKSYCC